MSADLTEWDLMQIRLGNKKAPEEKRRDPNWRDPAIIEEEKRLQKLHRVVMNNLDELEEGDDEAALRHLREKRILELKDKALRDKYGELYEINEPEYKSEVTEMKGVPIVVFLFRYGIGACDIMEEHVRSLSRRYRSTKFVKIRASSAIRDYPDELLPTLIVYFNGDVIGQVVTLKPVGGNGCQEVDIEWALHQFKALEGCELEEDPRADKPSITRAEKASAAYVGRRTLHDSDDEFDEDDW